MQRKHIPDAATLRILSGYASRYECAGFLNGDPSYFMHQVKGPENQEATAFVAANLSYGRRDLFMPRIAWILDRAGGDIDGWLRTGRFRKDFRTGDMRCFYRLYTYGDMAVFFSVYSSLLDESGTLGLHVRDKARAHSGYEAVEAICRAFAEKGGCSVVPKDTQSACKRICMFLRWMVRDDSAVDLGLWRDFIDKRTLIIPLDTHVLQEAATLGLLSSRTASMSTARKLSAILAEYFPDDPMKGDFALFGYGVNH